MKGWRVVFIVVVSFLFTCKVLSQPDSTHINYNCTNKLISNVFKDIEEQYGIKFFYDQTRLKDSYITLSFEQASLNDFLQQITNRKPWISQVIQSDLVVIFPIEEYAYYTGQMVDLSGQLVDLTVTVVGDPNDLGKKDHAILSGIIRDGSTGDILIGATIQIENTTTGVTSDIKGKYEIPLKPGLYTLSVSSIGFEKSLYKVKILSDGAFNIDLYETSHNIDEVSVYAQRADENVKSSQMGMIELDSKGLKHLPSISGDRDLIKSLTSMPGVQSVGEFGSGINVRGGGEDQNLFLIEGAPLFNTSHVLGLLSVLNPDVVSSLTLYKGHIPASYGERVASVMNIQVRENISKELHARGGIGVYNSRLMIEGPISKNLSIKIGGRSSYSDWILGKIKDYNLQNSSAGFYDLNGLISYTNNKDRITLFGYYSNDNFMYAKQTEYVYGNILASLSWRHAFTGNLASDLELASSAYSVSKEDFEQIYSKTSKSIDYKSAKYKFSYTGLNKHTIEFGLQGIYYTINPGEIEPRTENELLNTITLPSEQAVETGIFINDKFDISDKITLNGGIRLSNYFYLGPGTVYDYGTNNVKSEFTISDTSYFGNGDIIQPYHLIEPRASIVYSLEKNNSLKLSYNRNSQYISLISHTSISKPENIWKLADSYSEPVIANIFSIGYFQNFLDNSIEASIEFYYKTLHNLIDYKNNAKLEYEPDVNSETKEEHRIERELVNTFGKNYGIEFFVRKNKGKLQGSLSYTYSRSFRKTNSILKEEKIQNNTYYPSSFDKPNDLFVQARYNINRRWAISGNFIYITGRPINLPEYKFTYGSNEIAYYISRNQYRTPSYHRLDFSVHLYETLRLKKKWKGNWTFTIMNLYGRNNAYSIFYKKEHPDITNDFERFSLYKIYLIGIPFPTLTYNFIF